MSTEDETTGKVLELPGAVLEQPPKPTAKVLPMGLITVLDLDPDTVLENNKGRFEGFVYAAYDKDGEIVTGSTYADGGTVLWLLEIARKRLLQE